MFESGIDERDEPNKLLLPMVNLPDDCEGVFKEALDGFFRTAFSSSTDIEGADA